jgi:uridine kinase
MKFPPGEGDMPRVQVDTLETYLRRGGYERIDATYSSYGAICEHLIDTDPGSIVAIDGPSGSGKTSLTKALVNSYERHGVPVTFIPLDYFLTDRATRSGINQAISAGRLPIADYSAAGWEQQRYRETILLIQEIVRNGSEPYALSIPRTYDRLAGTNKSTQSVVMHPGSIIVTEGVGIQTYHGELFNTKIRVDVNDHAALLKRVLEREHQKPKEAAHLSDDFLRMRYEVVDAPHTKHLRANSPVAEFVIDTSKFDKMLLYKHQ